MINLKRGSIAAAAVLALSAGLAGCGANSEDAASAETTPSVSQAADTADAKGKADASAPASSGAETSSRPSPSPAGPYEPATSKHPARNVPDPGPLPKVATEKSKAGQVAFIEHWFKEFNYGLETNTVRPEFWEMTSKSCNYCKSVQKVREMMKKDNSWNIGGELNGTKIQPDIESLENGVYQVPLVITEKSRKRYFPNNPEPVEEFEGGTVEDAFVELRRVNGQWRMEGLYVDAN